MEIIVKNYQHFNRSFKHWDTPKGKFIGSKRQYQEAMAREGMVPYEKAKAQAESFNKKLDEAQYRGISPKAESLIRSVHGDRKGKIKLSDRQIDAMKEVGVHLKVPSWCPREVKGGGYSNE